MWERVQRGGCSGVGVVSYIPDGGGFSGSPMMRLGGWGLKKGERNETSKKPVDKRRVD